MEKSRLCFYVVSVDGIHYTKCFSTLFVFLACGSSWLVTRRRGGVVDNGIALQTSLM